MKKAGERKLQMSIFPRNIIPFVRRAHLELILELFDVAHELFEGVFLLVEDEVL